MLLLKELIESPYCTDICVGEFTHQMKDSPLSAIVTDFFVGVFAPIKGEKRGEERDSRQRQHKWRQSGVKARRLCQLSVIINSLTILSANYA